MDKKDIKFSEIEIGRHKYHQHKNPISIYDVDIKKILVPTKFSFGKKGFKYFIDYKDG